MTILPKKKSTQQKTAEGEKPTDSINHTYAGESHGHPSHAQEGRERFSFGSRTSPPTWPLHASREEKRPAHSSGSEYVNSDCGPSHSKRRHQTSPHRSVRKRSTHSNHSHRNGSSSLNYPIPGPSHVSLGTVQERQNREVIGQGKVSQVELQEEDPSGYNSGDEYDRSFDNMSEEELAEKERLFEEKLHKKGYSIKKMGEDGACMFRAVADQIYGDQEMHTAVRKLCMDYMAKNSDYYSQYVTEDFDKYVQRKRCDHIHGNHIEMQAMSEMFNRHIEVYHYSSEPINIFHGSQKTDNEPIRLSYHRNVHYNSIVDPYKATIGVGLGLPSFKPDLMNKTLVSDAIRASENLQLEQAMLEDKLRATDWEATNEAIEEQVARESYLEWLRDNEMKSRTKVGRTATATSSSSLVDGLSGSMSPQSNNRTLSRSSRCSNSASSSPKNVNGNDGSNEKESSKSPQISLAGTSNYSEGLYSSVYCNNENNKDESGACGASTSTNGFALDETASFLNQLPPSVFGLSDWEDSGILAKVLAESQQEYIDSLKRSNSNN